jgi:hypothetical protein
VERRFRRRCLGIGLAAGVVSLIADYILVLGNHHATPIWGSGAVGYWPFFAAFWFLVFVFGSKWIGKVSIQKRENYYGDDDA